MRKVNVRGQRGPANIGFLLTLTVVVTLLTGCMAAGANGSEGYPAISVQALPSGVTSLDLRISGPGMQTLNRSFGGGTSIIVVPVPVGPARLFTLGGGAYLGWTRQAVAPGGVNVELKMLPGILIPDSGNARLVQVRDFQGTGWIIRDNTAFPQGLFQPEDAAFAPDGTIFVASSDSTFGGVFKLSRIDAAPQLVQLSPGAQYLAIDPAALRLYFTTTSGLFGIGAGATGLVDLGTLLGLVTPTAVAVGPGSVLYVVAPAALRQSEVLRAYRTETWQLVGSVDLPYNASDITVFDNTVYVASASAPAGYVITTYSLSLQPRGHFGSTSTSPTGPGEFYGPVRFLANNRGKLIVSDAGLNSLGAAANRIVGFTDDGGADWQIYGSNGTGVNQFSF